ncbi:hypothetical protein OS493_005768 [Desmophyllum pertusum]|uniref:Uncharacterized protein n=1 Tax=Desmophyllum pertusum TaxID=174260 RepID=A0A9W9YGV7_9CNID|nr:hypothetical protein OS493_005768 [Desmophyllum pertusum]
MEEECLRIRANAEDLGSLRLNCVDMELIGSVKGKDKRTELMSFSGQFTLSIDRAKQGTCYKYVVIEKGDVHCEYLAEFPPRNKGEIINRFLSIPDKYLKPGATWHKFDGVTYIYGERRWLERVCDYFRSEETVENRTTALLAYLPKWKGFLVDGAGEEMTATDALLALDKVVHSMTNVWVKQRGYRPEEKAPASNFDICKVLVEHLQPKIKENAAVLAPSNLGFNTRFSVLVSSLAIVLVLKNLKYNTKMIKAKRKYVLSLLRCLSLEADPTEQKCTTYEVVLDEFCEGLRK